MTYDLQAIRKTWHKEDLRTATGSMWRYAPVLPAEAREAVSLGEGWTPLLRAHRLEREFGARELWIKEESRNPTGSREARRFSCAATVAKKLGLKKLAMASAGKAASALAAYAAAAGLEAQIFMPRDVPHSIFVECKALGASVRLVDGEIDDCARLAAEQTHQADGVEMAALEPHGTEGSKTVGYEIAEQLSWRLPDAIAYAEGEVDQTGMSKAFAELEELGWIGSERPRLFAVQAAGPGSRIPGAERNSGPISVSMEDGMDAGLQLARCEGIFPAPEGGACVAAVRRLLGDGDLTAENRIVIVNPGSGLKHLEAYSTRFSRQGASEHDKLGGLITPR